MQRAHENQDHREDRVGDGDWFLHRGDKGAAATLKLNPLPAMSVFRACARR
jgi:hypothetical protein